MKQAIFLIIRPQSDGLEPLKRQDISVFLNADGCEGNVYLFASVVVGVTISPVGFIHSKKGIEMSGHSGCGFKSLGL